MRCFQAPRAPVLPRDSAPPTPQKATPRNPILLSQTEDEQPQPRFSRARIATNEISQTRYLAERPRGLAKGQFSSASHGSFSVGTDSVLEFTPGRRMVENQTRNCAEKVTRKRHIPASEIGDPILQTEPRFEPEQIRPRSTQDWRPSPITEYSNQRHCMLPAELGKTHGEFFERRNRSSVFSDEGEDRNTGARKRVEGRSGEASAVLQYKYALPYRDFPISEKPQHVHPSESLN